MGSETVKSYYVLVIVAGVNTVTSIHKTYEGAVDELINQARWRVDGFNGSTTEQLDRYLEKMEERMVLVEFNYEINMNEVIE